MKSDTYTILLVEDNPDDQELTRLAFKECNFPYELVIAGDGQDALDYLFATGKYSATAVTKLPQLVLLDLKLPKVSGFDVLKRVRSNARTRSLPVVVLTSSNEEQDLLDSHSFGANSYVRKPVSFNEFTDTVRRLGIYWMELNKSARTLRK